MSTMNKPLTIGELAKQVGVAGSTVRYYERRGLLRPEGRSSANYRVYGPNSVSRLRFIRAAQSSGLSLEDIATVLRFADGAVAPCEQVLSVIDSRLEHVGQQLADLRAVQRTLQRLHEACCSPHQQGQCPAIEEFRRDLPSPKIES